MRMEWDDSFSVGIPRFDDQHKKLFEILNTLIDGVREKRHKEIMGETLEELLDYTVKHFGEEEKEMETHGYYEYDRHKKEHEDLASQVRDFRTKFKAGTAPMSTELISFIVNWLKTHIAHTDKKYGPFLSQKGVR